MRAVRSLGEVSGRPWDRLLQRALSGEVRLLLRLLASGVVLLAAARFLFLVFFADRFARVDGLTQLRAFAVGSWLDVSFLAWLLLPVWLLVFLPRTHWRNRPWVRAAVAAWTGICTFLLLIGVASDLAHYREFDVRLNGTSLDYLRNPLHLLIVLYHEFFLLPTVAALLGATWLVMRRVRANLRRLAPLAAQGRRRPLHAAGVFLLLILAGGSAPAMSQRVPNDGTGSAYFSHSYVASQLALNGPSSFVVACISELGDESLLRRRVAATGGDGAVSAPDVVCGPRDRLLPGGENPLWRVTDTGRAERRANVVVVLMESFSARGVASLGAAHDDAPQFDRLAQDGVLFTDLYAVGTRTNRALAGVLSSMPALPGLSPICALEPGARMFTIADVLRGRGYRTLALYGGDRHYDNLDRYLCSNGFERLLALEDMPEGSFVTEWGVADEVLFDRALEEFSRLAREDEPFLGFVLTLSNHRPYRVPAGRVEPADPEDDEGLAREAFRYADWALGRFVERARREAWFDDTLFVLVADHGRELRGDLAPDVGSFRVPLLLYAPTWLEPGRVDGVASQLDVAPTVMGLLGGAYEHCFFGGDALDDGAPGRAVMSVGDYLLWSEHEQLTVWPPEGPLEHFVHAADGSLRPVGAAAARPTAESWRAAEERLAAVTRAAFELSRAGSFRAPR